MKLKCAVVKMKLREREEPEETLLISVATEDRQLVVILKDNSTSETFNDLKSRFGGTFFVFELG
jgi:hypothetical protein